MPDHRTSTIDLSATDRRRQSLRFGELCIEYDDRVLEPRPWTELQSRWAAELLHTAPSGPVLELCAGAGQIGLLAVHAVDRRLVCVDADPVACDFALHNAIGAELDHRVEVRCSDLGDAVRAEERFALVIADPPWVRTSDVSQFPQDPRSAIDGGPDGLDVARRCLETAARHLQTGATVLLQLGDLDQVAAVLDGTTWQLVDTRAGARGVVAALQAAKR